MSPRAPWTVERLAELRSVRMRLGLDLPTCAALFGESASSTNLALDALLGRTPEAAAEALNGARPPGATAARPGGVQGFVRRMFGGEP